jgi:aldehyde reductase
LEAGYRHIDTAYVYLNEDAIGEVLQEWIQSGKIKREELFIVTKVQNLLFTKKRYCVSRIF